MDLLNDIEYLREPDDDLDLEDRDDYQLPHHDDESMTLSKQNDSIDDLEDDNDALQQLVQPSDSSSVLKSPPSNPPPLQLSNKEVYWNILAVLILSFAGEASRGLVIPSLWSYLNSMGTSRGFYGACISVFSVTRFVGSVGLGYLSDFISIKLLSTLSIAVCLLGNCIYALATLTPTHGKWVILVSRGVLGIGTSVVLLVRTQIAVVSPAALRTRFFSWGAAAAYTGVALTPGLGTLLARVNFDIGGWAINGNSSPGFFLMLFYVPVLVAVHYTMHDVTGATKVTHVSQESPIGSNDVPSQLNPQENSQGNSQENSQENSPQENQVENPQDHPPTTSTIETTTTTTTTPTGIPLYVNIGFFVFVNFTARICIALVETTGTPMFLEATGQDSTIESIASASEFFEALGFGGLLVFPCLEWIEKAVSGSLMLDLSFILIAIGCFLQAPYGGQPASFPSFVVANTLIWSIASPITQVLVISGLVSILGGQPPGRFLAMISGGGSVARMLGPIFATTAPYIVVFPVIGALSLFTAALLTLFYIRSRQQN